MITIFTDFIRGVQYVAKGIRSYYADRSLWKYGIIPMLISILIYAAVFTLCAFFLKGWIFLIGLVVTILIVPVTLSCLYEGCCGIFLDALVTKYELKKYDTLPHPSSKGIFTVFLKESIVFSLKTLGLTLILLPVIFIPIAGKIIFIAVIGYRFSISCMLPAAVFHGVRIKEFRAMLARKKWGTLSFGMASYLLLMIPFATVFVLPGLIIGGVDFYNHELKGGY